MLVVPKGRLDMEAAVRLRANWHDFVRDHHIILTVFVVALLCDAASTAAFMVGQGVEAEIHPLVRTLSLLTGPLVGPFLGAFYKIATGIFLAVYLRNYAFYVLLGPTLTALWAASYNLTTVRLLLP